MKRCQGSFISTRRDISGNQISEEVMHKVLDDQAQVPIMVDFTGTPVGKTIRYNLSGAVVFCEFEVEDHIVDHKLFGQLYLVPIFDIHATHRDGRTKILDEATLTSAMLTYLPADPMLSTVKSLKGES